MIILMSKEVQSVSTSSLPVVGGPLPDNPSLQIIMVKLDVTNYLTWSRSAILSIQSCGLYGYLTIDAKKQENIEPLYDKWMVENSLAM